MASAGSASTVLTPKFSPTRFPRARAECTGLADVPPVELLQDQAQCILAELVRQKHPRQGSRFGRLLLLLPCLRSVRSGSVDALFFRQMIGEMSVEKLLVDIYYMDKLQ